MWRLLESSPGMLCFLIRFEAIRKWWFQNWFWCWTMHFSTILTLLKSRLNKEKVNSHETHTLPSRKKKTLFNSKIQSKYVVCQPTNTRLLTDWIHRVREVKCQNIGAKHNNISNSNPDCGHIELPLSPKQHDTKPNTIKKGTQEWKGRKWKNREKVCSMWERLQPKQWWECSFISSIGFQKKSQINRVVSMPPHTYKWYNDNDTCLSIICMMHISHHYIASQPLNAALSMDVIAMGLETTDG